MIIIVIQQQIGEELFYNNIKDKINVIFDVGSCDNSSYINFTGEVHYFEPVNEYIEKLKNILNIKTAKTYIDENNITNIDFLKMDTEGYELEILEGFGDFLKTIKIIQFEYGGTNIDNNVKLLDMINFLKSHGFYKFAYLTNYGTELLTDFNDHYQYCNIVCINENSDIIPY